MFVVCVICLIFALCLIVPNFKGYNINLISKPVIHKWIRFLLIVCIVVYNSFDRLVCSQTRSFFFCKETMYNSSILPFHLAIKFTFVSTRHSKQIWFIEILFLIV